MNTTNVACFGLRYNYYIEQHQSIEATFKAAIHPQDVHDYIIFGKHTFDWDSVPVFTISRNYGQWLRTYALATHTAVNTTKTLPAIHLIDTANHAGWDLRDIPFQTTSPNTNTTACLETAYINNIVHIINICAQTPFRVIVLTKNRPRSLYRTLQSIKHATYNNKDDPISVTIHIDGTHQDTLRVATRFQWPDKTIVSTQTGSLRAAWLHAWPHPQGHAIILEDDVELSPAWYTWLSQAWDTYGDRTDIAGISLQRQTLIPQNPHKTMEIVNDHLPFLYKLVGSIGFSPHPQRWQQFLDWVAAKNLDTFDAYVPNLITSDWYTSLDKSSMWTQLFIRFCEEHTLYTLYINLPDNTTLAAHWREKGEHFNGHEGRDFALAQTMLLQFPPYLNMYGWNGNILSIQHVNNISPRPEIRYTGSPYGGWTYNATGITPTSIVYSVGLGEDTSWDEAMIRDHNLHIWGFDPTPKSIQYIHNNIHLNPTNFHFTAEGLATLVGNITFTKPANPDHVSMRQGVHSGLGISISVPVNTMDNWMNANGHSHIDILKLDIEGSEYDVLDDWIARKWFPMNQLLVEFHQRYFQKDQSYRHTQVLRGLQENGFRIIHNSNDAEISFQRTPSRPLSPSIPIVFISLNYQLFSHAPKHTIPFLCEKNNRVVVLTNIPQHNIPKNTPCLHIVNILSYYHSSTKEMPWPTTAPKSQKVFFDRWYILRNWMRRSGTSQAFTMDSDAILTLDISKFVASNIDILKHHSIWIVYNPPRSSLQYVLTTEQALSNITAFWNRMFHPSIWSREFIGGASPNDMIAMGHYSHMAVGTPYPCWGYGPSHLPGSCNNTLDYGHTTILDRLLAHNIKATYPPGTLTLNKDGIPQFSQGIVDNNYRHDPLQRFVMHNGQKQLRFRHGVPQLKLKTSSSSSSPSPPPRSPRPPDPWVNTWAYILEDDTEACTQHHLSLIQSKSSCTCNTWCCTQCTPYQPTCPHIGGASTHIWDAPMHTHTSDMHPTFNITHHHQPWSMDPSLLQSLSRNHRAAYKLVYSTYHTPSFNTSITAMGKTFGHRIATYTNAYCTTDGFILDTTTCTSYRNAGCDILKKNIPPTPNPAHTKTHNTVITIAIPWGAETWHFVGEALVGLALIAPTTLSNSTIHVSKITPFVLQWLNIVGIHEHQIISGPIFASTLLVPEPGKCGNPSPYQLHWLRQKISTFLASSPAEKQHTLLIKRTQSRQQHNYNNILSVLQDQYTTSNIVIHDDSHLPSVKRQLLNFKNAHTIVAPHGAGLINILAASSSSSSSSVSASIPTTIIEFMDTKGINLCYSRLAYILNLKYIAISMDAPMPHLNTIISQSISQHHLTPPPCTITPNIPFKSQSDEDKAMFTQFYKSPPKCNGVFVEIGALDGLRYSNSYFFEKALNWKCLLVEANPENAAQLHKNRPNAWTIHSAMCQGDNVQFKGRGAVGGVIDDMPKQHMRNWIKSNDKLVTVPCRKWSSLFTTYNITHIDIFVIDVEGAELSVLQVMDWSVTVDYFIIETSSNPEAQITTQKIKSLLSSKGYHETSWNLKAWCIPGKDCTANTVFTSVPHRHVSNSSAPSKAHTPKASSSSSSHNNTNPSPTTHLPSSLLQEAIRIHATHNVVIIQLLNTGYIELTKNWICNVRRFNNILKKTLFITTDHQAYSSLSTFDASLNIVLYPYNAPPTLQYGQAHYFNYMLFRTRLISSLLCLNLTVWLTESDAVWLNDPSHIVLTTPGNIVTMSDSRAPQRKIIQGGLLLLRPASTTVTLWSQLLVAFKHKLSHVSLHSDIGDSGSEQLLLTSMVHPHNVAWLNPTQFVSGQWYTDASYRSFAPSPYIILNNYIIGNTNKIMRAKKWNHWFLRSSSTQCL